MIELLLIILLGITAGIVTGLIPGIHPNTVVFASLPYYLQFRPELNLYLVFIAALSVSHTFHDFLPAIFLHAPNAATALSTIPGAEAVKNGEGLKAFYKTASGGLLAITAVALTFPVLVFVLKPFYSFVQPLMVYILLFFLLFAVLNSDSMVKSFQISALSGFLGVFAFNMPVNQNYVLIPVFSGLFAVPALTSVFWNKGDLPEQDKEFNIDVSTRSGVIGASSGLLAGIVPGIGPAIATSFLSPLQKSKDDFITALGGVNSSDIVTSMIALYILNKPRSGASVAINQLTSISKSLMATLTGAILLSAAASFLISTNISKNYVDFVKAFDYSKIVFTVLLIVTFLSYWFMGVLGLLVLFTSSAIGFTARAVEERAVLMSVLIVPALLMFSGAGVTM